MILPRQRVLEHQSGPEWQSRHNQGKRSQKFSQNTTPRICTHHALQTGNLIKLTGLDFVFRFLDRLFSGLCVLLAKSLTTVDMMNLLFINLE